MRVLFIVILFCSSTIVYGQKKSNPINNQSSYDAALYGGIRWRELGPFRGGRSSTATGIVGNDKVYYFGSTGSGVWKTEDGGQTWFNTTDAYFGGTVGAVAVAQSDPNVIYAGEGEQTLRNNVSSGWGVWKSTDAGKTWRHIGLKDSRHISRIRIHPTDPDVVYVAAMGNLWKPNEMRGVYKSTDGGASWRKVLYINDQAGAGDLILDPSNPRIMYAATWNMKRNGWRMDSGGPDSKLWKSTDGGETWENLSDNAGMPKGINGIIGITVSPVNASRLWAIIENTEAPGVYRSDDAGQTWQRVNQDRALLQRAWYYCRIYADSKDLDKVFVLNVSYGESKDGGKTFVLKDAPHGDHHDLWIDPLNNMRMVMADDGGAQVSNDGGKSWTTYYNQPTAQFYRVTTDNAFPYNILGAQQDNTSVRMPHRTKGIAITDKDWLELSIGESAHLAVDPSDPSIIYGSDYKGYMSMQNLRNGQERSTNVWPDLPAGSGAEVMKYRFNWNYPLLFSPHNPAKLYAGSNYLHVSYNGGSSWQVISPDLTRAEPETIRSSGGPITQDNTGAEYYANLFVISESPYTENEIWTGSDDGLLHLTTDGGKSWKNVTPPGSPKYNMWNSISVNPFVKGGAYAVATSYKFGDYTPYVYKTVDYGQTWSLITKGIPSEEFVRVVRADPKRPGLLYAGTEKGMWISFDNGNSWQQFQLNLPKVPVHDLAIKDDNLIVATHGRGFWMIDDLTVFHQLSQAMASKPLVLFKPMPSFRMPTGMGWGEPDRKLQGENHPGGVMIHFYVKSWQEGDEVILEVMEEDGDIIQTYSSLSKDKSKQLPVKQGGARFVWDMRYPGYQTFPGMVYYGSPNRGPMAVPGNYKVRLSHKGISEETTFTIVKDPRVNTSQADYQAQFDFLMKVRDKVSEANKGVSTIRKIKEDLLFPNNKIGMNPEYQAVQEAIKAFDTALDVHENQLHQTKNKSVQDPLNYGIKINNRLAHLMVEEAMGDFAPTEQAEQVRQMLSKQVDDSLQALQSTLLQHANKINVLAKEKGLTLIMLPVPPKN